MLALSPDQAKIGMLRLQPPSTIKADPTIPFVRIGEAFQIFFDQPPLNRGENVRRDQPIGIPHEQSGTAIKFGVTAAGGAAAGAAAAAAAAAAYDVSIASYFWDSAACQAVCFDCHRSVGSAGSCTCAHPSDLLELEHVDLHPTVSERLCMVEVRIPRERKSKRTNSWLSTLSHRDAIKFMLVRIVVKPTAATATVGSPGGRCRTGGKVSALGDERVFEGFLRICGKNSERKEKTAITLERSGGEATICTTCQLPSRLEMSSTHACEQWWPQPQQRLSDQQKATQKGCASADPALAGSMATAAAAASPSMASGGRRLARRQSSTISAKRTRSKPAKLATPPKTTKAKATLGSSFPSPSSPLSPAPASSPAPGGERHRGEDGDRTPVETPDAVKGLSFPRAPAKLQSLPRYCHGGHIGDVGTAMAAATAEVAAPLLGNCPKLAAGLEVSSSSASFFGPTHPNSAASPYRSSRSSSPHAATSPGGGAFGAAFDFGALAQLAHVAEMQRSIATAAE
jgi:hypothetical protein